MTTIDNQKTAPFFKFENLRIYHKALTFSTAVLALYDRTENDADRMVIQKLFETASTITSNIIEGSTSNKSAFINYLQQAKSNIRVCVTLCALLLNRKVIDEEQANDIRNELIELTKMTGALIVSLQGENV